MTRNLFSLFVPNSNDTCSGALESMATPDSAATRAQAARLSGSASGPSSSTFKRGGRQRRQREPAFDLYDLDGCKISHRDPRRQLRVVTRHAPPLLRHPG